jgi:hypothetical protein
MPLTPPPSAPPAAPDAPGAAPSRANPSTFRALADAFVVWMASFGTSMTALVTWLAGYITWAGTHVTEMNALQTDVSTKQGQAAASASSASTSATNAAASASSASTSATNAAASEVAAETAQTATELARDVALAASRIYSSAAAGQADAGLAVGAYFYVVASSNEHSLELWQKDGGTGTDTGERLISSNYVTDHLDTTYSRPDRLYSWLGDDGGEVLYLDENGDLNDRNNNISQAVDGVNGVQEIVCFGDSLTQGSGWGFADSYPTMLAALTGLTVGNRGVSAFTAERIATTHGAVVSLMTFPSNTIPASGPVTVSSYTHPIRGDIGVRTITGYLLSGAVKIPGTIEHTGVSGGLDVYTFTRTTPGSAIEVDPKTPFIVDQNDDDYKIQIWWAGRNGYGLDPTGAALISYYQRMRDFLKPAQKRFVILGIINGWGWNEFPGGVPISAGGGEAGYNQIKAINDALKQEFPDNFIDIRKVLIRSYNPAIPQDVIDYGRDVVPASMAPDGLHLNQSIGKPIVAQTVYNFLEMKGWL